MTSNIPRNLLIGALVGGVLAASTVLLFTPFSGAQVRQRLRNKMNKINGSSSHHGSRRYTLSNNSHPSSHKKSTRKTTAHHSSSKHH